MTRESVRPPDGLFFSRNLTSDPATGLGRWSDDQVADAVRNGRSPTRTLNVVAMPWNLFHALSLEDALAIATYLKSLPAVTNAIPPPQRYGLLETVLMKLTRPLPSTLPKAMSYADGNFGNRSGTALWLPGALVWLQWGVFVGGLILVARAGPKDRLTPRTGLGWALLSLALGAGLLVALVASALFYLPALPMIPPQEIAKTALGEVYVPRPEQFGSPEHKAMVKRGRYLYTVASCALCHEGNGAGGAKVNWRPFGSLWVQNLTSDREFGLGNWVRRRHSARDPKRNCKGRPGAPLARNDLGLLVQLGRGGHPIAGCVLANIAGDSERRLAPLSSGSRGLRGVYVFPHER